MKQLTRVVDGRHSFWVDVGAGGQQHLGQHSRTDPPQMSHSQLSDVTQAKVGQNLLRRGTLRDTEMLLHFISSMHFFRIVCWSVSLSTQRF